MKLDSHDTLARAPRLSLFHLGGHEIESCHDLARIVRACENGCVGKMDLVGSDTVYWSQINQTAGSVQDSLTLCLKVTEGKTPE
jgi:hypothetical protein